MKPFIDDPTALGELFSVAIDASARPEAWHELCDRIVDQHGAANFMVFEYDLRDHAAPVFHGSRATREELSPFRRAFQEGDTAPDEKGYETLARTPAGLLLCEQELFGLPIEAPKPPNPWRDRLLKAVGAEGRYGMRLNDVGPFLDAAVYHAWQENRATHAFLKAEAAILHPVLAKTLEATRTIRALTRSYSVLLDLFDRLDFAVAFCDAAGRVLLENRQFKSLVAERNGIRIASQMLAGETSGASARIATCIGAAFNGASAPAELSTLLPRRDDGAPLLLRVAPVRESEVGAGAMQAMVLVLDPDDTTRLTADGLAGFGLLSQAELDVCAHLIRGLGTEDIAEQRDTTLETARSQIKAAQQKLGCRSRLDLLRLAVVSSPPVITENDPQPGN